MKKFLLTVLTGLAAVILVGCDREIQFESVEIPGFMVETTTRLVLIAYEFTADGGIIPGTRREVSAAELLELGIEIPITPELEIHFMLGLSSDMPPHMISPQRSTTGAFDPVTLQRAGTFDLVIWQTIEAPDGWVIDDNDFEITITVTEDEESEILVATVETNNHLFINTFTVDMTEAIMAVEPTVITVQFVGDVFLHRGPIEAARTNEGPETFDFRPFLTHIRPYIDADLRIANMETPVDVLGDNQDITTFPLFNAPFEILEALYYAGFQHLNTANNHSFDRHWGGLLATVANIERAGLTQTGMYVDWAAREIPTIKDVNGIQVGFISYTDSVNGLESFVSAEQNLFGVRRFRSHVMDDVPSMLESANWLREHGADVVIFSLHWGAEYVNQPTQMQRNIARALVEGGVDIIMGKHSHSPQPVEWHYREDGSRGFIMYSLGNFMADQTRLDPPDNRTQFGILATVQITRENNGEITLTNADVLPTLTMRDFNGNVLRHRNDVTVLPVIEGQIPAQFTDSLFRDWATRAYNHLHYIVGAEFITRRHGVELFSQD